MSTSTALQVTHAKISFSLGTALLLSILTVMLCLTLLMNPIHPTGRVGTSGGITSMSPSEVESNFGAVNKNAASELKQGLFSRIRERRNSQYQSNCSQQRRVSWSQPVQVSQPQSYATYSYQGYSQQAVTSTACLPCQPVLSQPVVYPSSQPATPASPAINLTITRPTNSDSVRIRPSCGDAECQP